MKEYVIAIDGNEFTNNFVYAFGLSIVITNVVNDIAELNC